MEDNKKVIMAIGGHVGDMELTAGGVLATMALKGYKIVTVALTGGERGCPPHLTVPEYRKQKLEEARIFAEMLGGESVVWDYPDCELPVNDETRFKLCDEIRKYKADILLTHWKGSIHKDHISTHKLVFDAQLWPDLTAWSANIRRSLRKSFTAAKTGKIRMDSSRIPMWRFLTRALRCGKRRFRTTGSR